MEWLADLSVGGGIAVAGLALALVWYLRSVGEGENDAKG